MQIAIAFPPLNLLGVDDPALLIGSVNLRSYFGVNSADASLTGLAEFTPGSVFKEYGATLILNRHMGGPWYAGVTTTASRLSSELADSPIVEQHGSRTRWLSGIFLTYHY